MKKDKSDDRVQMTDDSNSDNRQRTTVDGENNESKDSSTHISHLTSHGYDYPDDEIDLLELFAKLYKNKKIIFISTIIFLILGVFYSAYRIPDYKMVFFAKNGIKDFNQNTPIPSINITELSDWIESELYFDENIRNYLFEVEKKKDSNLLRFSSYTNDTKETYDYSSYFFKTLKGESLFINPLNNAKKTFLNSIESVNNSIKIKNVELENISNRIKEIDFLIQKTKDEIKITKDKIKEREKTLDEYRKLYSVNIDKNNEYQRKIESSATDSESTTYLLYSNLLQYNLNQNTELIKTINNYETSIKDMELRINELININQEHEIKKTELISKTKKGLEIDIQTLNMEKKNIQDKIERLNVLTVLNENSILSNKNKKFKIILLFLIIGWIFGIVFVFIKGFYNEIKKRMLEDSEKER